MLQKKNGNHESKRNSQKIKWSALGLFIAASLIITVPVTASATQPKGRQNRPTQKHNTGRKAVPLSVAKASPARTNNTRISTSRKRTASVSRSTTAPFTGTNSARPNYNRNTRQSTRDYDVDIHKQVRHDVYFHPNRDRDDRYRHDRDDHHRGIDLDIDFNFGFGHRYRHPYRPYYYPYHPYYYPYRRPVVVYPRPVVYRSPVVVYEPSPVVVINRYPDRYKYYIECDGWKLLAENHGYEALSFFEEQAGHYPNAALPRVGTALAHAELHEDNAAVQDMRWAFRRDPEALKYLPRPGGLDQQLYQLIEHYQYKVSYEPRNNDWHYMLASLNYFRQDYDNARYEINYILSRDYDPVYALKNLDTLVYEAQYRDDH